MEGRHFGLLRRPLSILIMEDIELPRRERRQYIKPRLYLRRDKYTRQSASNRCGEGGSRPSTRATRDDRISQSPN